MGPANPMVVEGAIIRRSLACRRLMIGTALAGAVFGCNADFGFRIPNPAVRYVAFGDSATRGPTDRDYPDFLSQALGEPAGAFANEGRGGETSDAGLERLNWLISIGAFPNAEVLLYWEGGNDLITFIEEFDPLLVIPPDSPLYPHAGGLAARLNSIQDSAEAAVRTAQGAGLRVYVATYYFLPLVSIECDPLPLDVLLPNQSIVANRYVALLNERLRTAARNTNASIVDVAGLDETLRGDPANYFNCNHLSPAGNEIVAGLFRDAILGGNSSDP